LAEYISVSEAAARSGMHPQSIRDSIKAGRLKGMKSGGIYLVDAEDLSNYQPIGHRPKKEKVAI
jgi:excisionase family DNA binding protein